jgi:OOP family OmpA-OmpF porin
VGLAYFSYMKRVFQVYLLPALLLASPAGAQSLTGVWQGVEDEFDKQRYCPSVLRVQQRAGTDLFGILFQQSGSQAGITVTFQMEGTPTPAGMRLQHAGKLTETGQTRSRYWCGNGTIAFTYDAAQEKLTGHAEYEPYGSCNTGEFVFYRVKLKSAATVPAGALSTLRVTGREVRWYANAERTQLVATGNTYPTRLRKTTTFYLTQNFYPTAESPVVPITIRVSGVAPAAAPQPEPAPAAPDTLRPVRVPVQVPPVAALPPVAAIPVVLPTVLFKLATAELLPAARPALNKLATELKARPDLRLRVAGHTDRVGESTKNQLLSEQRAEAVKAYLVQAGVAAERLSTVGYGDARPLYPAPDARNRRVEVQQVP